MHWMFGNYGMGFGSNMGFFMIFFWILVIAVIAMLTKGLLGGGKPETCAEKGYIGETSEEILKKRYARGEIGEEEFKRMRDNLH